MVDCEENPCVRMPCGEGGSCAVVRDQGFQCRCKAEFTGESNLDFGRVLLQKQDFFNSDRVPTQRNLQDDC